MVGECFRRESCSNTKLLVTDLFDKSEKVSIKQRIKYINFSCRKKTTRSEALKQPRRKISL